MSENTEPKPATDAPKTNEEPKADKRPKGERDDLAAMLEGDADEMNAAAPKTNHEGLGKLFVEARKAAKLGALTETRISEMVTEAKDLIEDDPRRLEEFETRIRQLVAKPSDKDETEEEDSRQEGPETSSGS